MKFIKKYKNYFLAFFLPFLIISLFFLWKGCFHDKLVLNSDMQAQYTSLFQYLRNVLHGDATFPYTFSKGLGGAMYGTYFYYLANPLNLLVYFFEDIPTFFLFLILLKISLSGFTMYLFLHHKFQTDDSKLLLFALAYALMSYNINYYINVMWLDGVILAPLLLISINYFGEKKKVFPYSILLFLSIFLNYYIGYILVFFSVLYFFYSYLLKYNNWKENKRIVIDFFCITLLTGLCTSFILIPSAIELLGTTRVPVKTPFVNWNFLDFLAPLYIGFGNLNNPLNYYGFCIFSGTLMLPLIICYFTNKRISKKEKILTMIIYFFFLLPIAFPFLNKIWHMFTLPQAFNFRYSFLATLFTIMIAYRSFTMLECSKKALRVFLVLFLIFSFSLLYVTHFTPEYYIFLDAYKIIVTVLLVILNVFLVLHHRKTILMGILCFELVLNLFWIGADSKMMPKENHEEAISQLKEFSSYCQKDYRCEKRGGYTDNDSLLMNYFGISHFLSTTLNKPAIFMLKAFGSKSIQNYYFYQPDVILDMLLGVQYLSDVEKIHGYEVVKEGEISTLDKTYYIEKNPNALSLGYLVSKNIKDWESDKQGFFYLEELLNQLSNEQEHYLISLPYETVNSKNYWVHDLNHYPYLYIYTDKAFEVEGMDSKDYLFRGDHYVILYDLEEELHLTFEDSPEKLEIYTIDMDKVRKFKDKTIEMQVDVNQQNRIEGHITAPEDSVLFLTIPYEKGWRIWIDGEERESFSALDSFLAVEIEKGQHEIVLEYHIPGLWIGTVVSIISSLLLIWYGRRYQKK